MFDTDACKWQPQFDRGSTVDFERLIAFITKDTQTRNIIQYVCYLSSSAVVKTNLCLC